MKIYTTHSRGILWRWPRFLGAMLALAFLVPVAAMSQKTAVNLGTAGNFAILAEQGITTTGTTHITGDIGISPYAASFITGFGLVADASTQFSTSSLITGKVYASNYGPPTPTMMTTAIGDMQTAYTDAAGRTLPDSTELGAGDITGKTLGPGLYKWSTGVQISAAGVTLSGTASDIWIFQIAQDLTVANGAAVILGGSAKASNIFWQVAGQVTIGTTAAMKGNILCMTQIAMSDSASLEGRALAQTAVTLIGNTVTKAGFAQLKDTVTFRVNMSIKMREGLFLPASGDTVRVVGSFNNWSASDTTVRMASTGVGDSIFTLTRILDSSLTSSVYDHNDTVFYKFYRTLRGGDWESVSNRVYKLVNGKHSTPIWLFDDDSVANLQVNVKFQVDMSVQMRQLGFQSGDVVRVAGSFNNWGSSTDTLKSTGSTDSVYTKTLVLHEGDKIQYKFLKTLRAGLDWENGMATSSGNREYTVPVGGATIKKAWFDNDSVYTPAIQVNLLWQTDMSAFITLGWFNPATDSVDVRGAFTGWGSTKMKSNLLKSNIWEFTSQNLISPIGNQLPFKYYVRYKDSASLAPKFTGYAWTGNANGTANTNVEDGIAYEHPVTRGDGNNIYTVTAATNQTPQRNWFSEVNPIGLLASTDTTNVTLSVNMGPAKRYSNTFVPGTDTLYLIWQDMTWWAAQAKIQGINTFKRNVKMTRQADTIYTVTFKVIGKTHYAMMYTYQYRKGDASIVDQGGGLGAQNLFNTRFIAKAGGVWPKTYSAPQDVWQKDSPLPFEAAPFTTDVQSTPTVPLVYSLSQNYPNPFNPTTNIRYSIPQQGVVKLRVYNILGQLVTELFNGMQVAGNHVVAFDASRLASGVYFYRLEAGSYVSAKKMILLK